MGRGQTGQKRDPTRLLREEKMRKRIAKDLPKIEAELKKILEKWEDEYGRPFCVHGARYLDELAAAAARAPAPRAKTPSSLPPPAKSTKPAPASASSQTNLGGSMRGLPPTRAGAKTPTGSVRGKPFASSTSTAAGRTPSKIPARVPLGHMRNGNNSPERRIAPETRVGGNAVPKMGPPSMAPPPRMRNLFVAPSAPTPVDRHHVDGQRSASVASSGDSVRHVSPEDVYDDREQAGYAPSSRMQSQQSTPQKRHDLASSMPYGDPYDRQQQQQRAYGPGSYGPAADSRQISTTSTATNTVSGSENWETYDDASEPEPDASDAYYAKLRAARGKRLTPEGGHSIHPGTKKVKGIRAPGTAGATLVQGVGGLVKVSGSEAGWTDEDAF